MAPTAGCSTGSGRKLYGWCGEAKSKPRHASMGSGVREKISPSVSTRCNGTLGSPWPNGLVQSKVERMRILHRAAVASTVRVAELQRFTCTVYCVLCRDWRRSNMCKVHPMCLPAWVPGPREIPITSRPSRVPGSLVHQQSSVELILHLPRAVQSGLPETPFNCSLLITTRRPMRTPSQPG